MLLLLVMYTCSGFGLALLSIPLVLGMVGPNAWYGFRVRKTLDNPSIWYPVNAYAARRLLVVGVLTVVSAVLFFCMPGFDVNSYAAACAAVTLSGLFVAVVQSALYLRSFPAKPR